MNTILEVAVSILLVASCTKASVNDGVSKEAAKKSSETRQYGYWTPNMFPYPSRSITPIVLPPRSVPINRRRRRPRPAREPPQASDDGTLIVMLFLAFSRLIAPPITTPHSTTTMMSTTTTTTMTTTTTKGTTTTPTCAVDWGAWTICNLAGLQYRSRVCPTGTETQQWDCSIDCLEWSEWSTCATGPIVVDEKKTRTRECKTGHETGMEACHTSATIGYTSDNWYRAGNGYEYYYIASTSTYTAALTICESIDPTAILASVGARSGLLGEAGFDADGLGVPDGDWYFVGASDSIDDGTWIFLDGVVRTNGALNWGTTAVQNPNGGTGENCMMWIQEGGTNGAEGLGDHSCSSREPAMCERKVA